ncbi:ABC transporter ATP-binding protein [Plantactinospora sp. ZYX-F-223]|uniref:ABC transporter ATP-binding protein n=1 Tax=Plantactinospora sp. ZYX-F-223 TaxID=3144103 RepID=UPI0031FCA45A
MVVTHGLPHADPGTPDSRSPGRYLWWLIRMQKGRTAIGALVGSAWMASLAIPPFVISKAIDEGIEERSLVKLLVWTGGFIATGVVIATLGILRHRLMTFARMDASSRTNALLVRHVSRLGAALGRRVASGEVVHASAADVVHISLVMTTTGPGVGAVIALIVVTGLLWSVSPVLATVVVIGVPALTVAVRPLFKRLETAEVNYRSAQGSLTTRASDVVAGLRVLAGFGGREIFADRYREQSQNLRTLGYRVAGVTSWIESLGTGLPALFVAVVIWLGARMAALGQITVGEMIAVYGYTAVLVTPVSFLIEGGYDLVRGRVAAQRVINVLNLPPAPSVVGPLSASPRFPASLIDPDSAVEVPAGLTVGLVSADSAGIAIADRIGRFGDTRATWGGVLIAGIPLAEVRRRILVAESESYLFAGTLRDIIRGSGTHGDEAIIAALHAAAADDLLQGLPDGLDTRLNAQARTLSGGQRQRLRLARALLYAPEVLTLMDPTSAVDTYTDATIAERLRAARSGLTTVVVTTSPVLLGQTDTVMYLCAGQVVARGSHLDLMRRESGYRHLVARQIGDDDDVRDIAAEDVR